MPEYRGNTPAQRWSRLMPLGNNSLGVNPLALAGAKEKAKSHNQRPIKMLRPFALSDPIVVESTSTKGTFRSARIVIG